MAVYARLGGGSAHQPVAVEKGPVAKHYAVPAVVNSFGDSRVDLPFTVFDANDDLRLVLRRQVLEVEGLARSDPDARKLSAYFCLVCFCGRKLQREVEVFEEVRVHERHADVRKVDGRR